MLSPVNDITYPEIDSLGNLSNYNKMILSYFMHMGYEDLCNDYANDLGIHIEASPLFIRRSKIRVLIENGDIEKAIEELNDLDIGIYRNKEMFAYITCHKAYELKLVSDEVDIIIYLRETLGELAMEYEEEVEALLEYIVFNSGQVEIQEKREELADRVNYFILRIYNSQENELEQMIKGILLEENVLSKKNKFVEFKERILEK